VEEVGERVLASEHRFHLFRRHRAVRRAAAEARSAEVRRPVAVRAGILRVLVLTPVRAELVVLPPFFRIAEHFVGFVDLLEMRLGRLVARIYVRVILPGQRPVTPS
jgi:hypothetical protein